MAAINVEYCMLRFVPATKVCEMCIFILKRWTIESLYVLFQLFGSDDVWTLFYSFRIQHSILIPSNNKIANNNGLKKTWNWNRGWNWIFLHFHFLENLSFLFTQVYLKFSFYSEINEKRRSLQNHFHFVRCSRPEISPFFIFEQ